MSRQINLYSENKSRRQGEFTAPVMLVYLGLVIMGALIFYGIAQFQNSKMNTMLENGRKRIDDDQKRLISISAEFSRKRGGLTLDQELKNVSDEAAAQKEIIQALKSGNIGNSTGYSRYMQAFARQIVNGMWLTGISIQGDATEIKLQGATLNPELVPEFIVRLNRETIMRGKMLAAMNMRHPVDENGRRAEVPYLEFDLQSAPAAEGEK